PMQLSSPNPTFGTAKETFGLGTVRWLARNGVAIIAFAVSVHLAQGGAGDLDQTFGRGGKVTTDFNGTTDIAYAIALQPDGKMVVAGISYANNDYSGEDFAVVRYNPNGTRDTTFGVNGKATTDFPNLASVPSAVIVQPDGKLLVVGGAFPLFTFLGDFAMVRYKANGTLDASFGTGGIVRTRFSAGGSYAFAAALQSDGKIIAAGTVFVDFSTDDSSNTDFALVRYNPNGTFDKTFGNGGGVITDFDGFNDDIYAVLLQPDGKIVTVGYPNSESSDSDFLLARCNRNGSLDSTFGVGGKVRTSFGNLNDGANAAALQSDGKIVAVGFHPTTTRVGVDFIVA